MWWNFNPKTITVSYTKLLTMLPRELVDSGNVKITDKVYKIPLSPKYIMKKVPSWKYSYKKDERDCDDSVRIFRGWLSTKGYGNIVAMDTEILMFNDVWHNLISFIDLERTDKHGKHLLRFGEPQRGEILPDELTRTYKEMRVRI